MFMKKKNAFSLAEIVVTIAVLGVIAAITVPSLQADARKKAQAAQIKKVYSELNQAVNLFTSDNGTIKMYRASAFTDQESFEEKFVKKYLNVVKVCPKGDSKDCFSDEIKAVSNLYPSYLLDNGVALQFQVAFPATRSTLRSPIIVDINGPNKPNKTGRDVFAFAFDYNNGNVYSYLAPSTCQNATCSADDLKQTNTVYIARCTCNLMNSGWEMKY